MILTRRDFVKTTAIGAVGIIGYKAALRNALAFNQSPGNRIPLFGTTLRGIGPGGIPVALPTAGRAPVTGVTRYNIQIKQFQDAGVCPALGPTTLWGYVPTIGSGDLTSTGSIAPRHLGGIIVGKRGVPIQINFKNLLNTDVHILPVDTTQLTILEQEGFARTAVHLHGGLVPWISDGGPFDWFDFEGRHGLSFLNNKILNPNAPANSAEYYYPMNQSARFMWYHDHAHGITRLNAYAGLASAMLIRDDFEAGLISTKGLPNYIEAGGNEIPLVFQDKIFVDKDIKIKDPAWASLVQKDATKPGSLWYAHTYEANLTSGAGRWDLFTPNNMPLPETSVVAEFFGDTMLVNGTTSPQATVQARRYRLRLLNACNARFLNLQLYVDDGSANGITLDPLTGIPTNEAFLNHAAGDTPNWLQIGAEGGFLSQPVLVPSSQPLTFLQSGNIPSGLNPDPNTGQTDPSNMLKSLIVAPAERPDLIVDFSGYAGKSVILYSDAPAPFPSGDDRNDYFPGWNTLGLLQSDGTRAPAGNFGVGNPVNATTQPGFAPNTRVLMRFNVIAATGDADSALTLDAATDLTGGIDPSLIPDSLTSDPLLKWSFTDNNQLANSFPVRQLTLNEYADEYGRLIQILGNANGGMAGSPYAGPDIYLGYPTPSPATPFTVGASWESVDENATEVWEVFNTTGDVHPMHIHLVNCQVINRQLFDLSDSTFQTFLGPIIPPEPNELGWKETVPMYPGTVTRLLMKFDTKDAQIVKADGNVIETPVSPREGIVGYEYVWHCHILEHEEHDMMHALVVTPAPKS